MNLASMRDTAASAVKQQEKKAVQTNKSIVIHPLAKSQYVIFLTEGTQRRNHVLV